MKDAEKTVEALSKLINTMKDLVKISIKHKIVLKLYNDDALERIYKMMGDGRIRRWLTSICDEELCDAVLWEKLIQFLEKEMKVQHQKILLQKSAQDNQKDPKERSRHGHHVIKDATQYSGYGEFGGRKCEDRLQNASNCFIYGEAGHASTNGPGGKADSIFYVQEMCRYEPSTKTYGAEKYRLLFSMLVSRSIISRKTQGREMSKRFHLQTPCSQQVHYEEACVSV